MPPMAKALAALGLFAALAPLATPCPAASRATHAGSPPPPVFLKEWRVPMRLPISPNDTDLFEIDLLPASIAADSAGHVFVNSWVSYIPKVGGDCNWGTVAGHMARFTSEGDSLPGWDWDGGVDALAGCGPTYFNLGMAPDHVGNLVLAVPAAPINGKGGHSDVMRFSPDGQVMQRMSSGEGAQVRRSR